MSFSNASDNPPAGAAAPLACPHCGKRFQVPKGALPQVAACLTCHNPAVFLEAGAAPVPAPGFGNIHDQAAEGTVLHRILNALPARLDELPVLPGVFQHVLSLIHDPISEMDDIVLAVERDATLTLHLLKTANSVLFRGATPIDDARTACVRLGMKEIANVVWRVQCARAFRSPRHDLSGILNDIWNMSVAAGSCARSVALIMKEQEPDRAFLAGLTHAVGQTLLVQILVAEPDFAIQRLSEHGDRCRQLLERHGPLMSMRVLQHWEMDPRLLATALYQRAPHLAPSPREVRMAHMLVLGTALARLCGFDTGGDEEMDARLLQTSCMALGFMPEQIRHIADKVRPDVEELVGAMALE